MTRDRNQNEEERKRELEREVNSWFRNDDENEGGNSEISESNSEEENENEANDEAEIMVDEMDEDSEDILNDENLDEEMLAARALGEQTVQANSNLSELILETYANLANRNLTSQQLNELDRNTIIQAGMIRRNVHGFLGRDHGIHFELIFNNPKNNPIMALIMTFENTYLIEEGQDPGELEMAGRSLLTFEELQDALIALIKSGVNPNGFDRNGHNSDANYLDVSPLLTLADYGNPVSLKLATCLVENGADLNIFDGEADVFTNIIETILDCDMQHKDKIHLIFSLITKSQNPINNINKLSNEFFVENRELFIELSDKDFTFFKAQQYKNLSPEKQDFINHIEVYRDNLYNAVSILQKSNDNVTSDNPDYTNPFLTLKDKANLLSVAKRSECKQENKHEVDLDFANENKSELANPAHAKKSRDNEESDQNPNKKSKIVPGSSPTLTIHLTDDIEMLQRVNQSRTGEVGGVKLVSRDINSGAGISNL